MSPKDRNLVIAAVAICLVIAALAPFIASSNPDGLEKTAEQVSTTQESGTYQAPFADYTIGVLGNNPLSGMVALALGVFLTLIIAYIIAILLKRRKPPQSSK